MKFTVQDRLLQLGVVPALAAVAKAAHPEASISLWQRDAKDAHRHLVGLTAVAPGTGPFARQGRALVSLSALLLGFHMAAPAPLEPDEALFGQLVEAALSTPIVTMGFAGASPFCETGSRELQDLLSAGDQDARPGLYAGTLRADDAQGGSLICTVCRCGLASLCVQAKRWYLLKYLCALEGTQAQCAGAVLRATERIATGAPACELWCSRR